MQIKTTKKMCMCVKEEGTRYSWKIMVHKGLDPEACGHLPVFYMGDQVGCRGMHHVVNEIDLEKQKILQVFLK